MDYCNCTNKKKVNSSAYGNKFEVCSKNLGGCCKEISSNPYSRGRTSDTVNITASDIGKEFRTRDNKIVTLINVSSSNYPCEFEHKSSYSCFTTSRDGRYSPSNEHANDITEML